jgi:aryl-alcohol dehydrogenase-like predicted oxidoreductase
LRIDTIDLYQFHSGSDEFFVNENLWKMLGEEIVAGKIRRLGVSIPGKGSDLQAREASRLGATALQVVYNRLDRRAEQMYFPHAERDQLGVLGRVPLASGLLSGKFKPGVTFPQNDVRATFDAARMQIQLAEVEEIARTKVPPGVLMSHWALAWCLKNPLVSAVIPGCKNPAQVEANARAAELVE